ncbi:hypothetical protein BCU70_00225 [Vibrio sp. 10N.286.49.C2]|uniref:DUF1496 domain-containing protein n=1 Tax=unclassified Vibrio TaxID=2614977 RepID=UPI000C821619|nr:MULTISPECIES: DUF1496 domain-containing protein [unclassified Vibrio]PMH43335.1 hypothetical protein BCU70_00225 [Vibrio sp. 10N.286.49.C2]PMH56987.1 hypothetical protein BCU66_05615 [Vibrio sp. 10N.286.49.B1]PMH79123.1 hypothetical protein BCU58_06465 [Vibrio sp. 10N.286.48.B7]
MNNQRKQWKTWSLVSKTGLILLLGTAIPFSAVQAKVISTPGVDVGAAVLLSDAKIGKRVCYYSDKAFSLGSVISVEGVVLQCVAEQDFEMNGELKWVRLKSEP